MYSKRFTQSEVEKIREDVKAKNLFLGYNNLKVDKNTRWVGELGELTFKEYLDDKGTDYKKVSDMDMYNKNPVDFIVGPHNIDVKTVATQHSPKPHYGCNVAEKQHNKEEHNAYVFCRYVIPTRTCYLLGWITKQEFEVNAVFREEGEVLNKMISNTNFYEIRIENLWKMFLLLQGL